MARSTQYIGLNADALAYVSTLERIDSDNHTTGMFDERIPLGKWRLGTTEVCVLEKVQAEPWSSGPVIFTALKLERNGFVNDAWMFPWQEDPHLNGGAEFNIANGTYWV
jgi:hypothetical protein